MSQASDAGSDAVVTERGGLRHVGMFATSTLLLGVAGIAVVPAIIAFSSAEVWASVAVGQALGILGSVITGYGWAVTGPADLARLPLGRRFPYLALSLVARAPFAAAALVAGAATLWLIAPGFLAESVVAYAATTLSGLSCTWYYVGVQRPLTLLWAETLPRVGGSLGAVLLMWRGVPTAWALTSLVAGMVGALALVALVEYRRSRSTVRNTLAASHLSVGDRARATMRRAHATMVSQSRGFGIALANAASMAAPMVLAPMVFGGGFADLALVDKLIKQSASVMAPIINSLQGWVPAAKNSHGLVARLVRATRISVGSSAALLLVLLVAAPPILHLMGAGRVAVAYWLVASGAVLAAASYLERIYSRTVLIALGLSTPVLRVSVACALAGVIFALGGAALEGEPGYLAGYALGALVSVTWMYFIARRRTRVVQDSWTGNR